MILCRDLIIFSLPLYLSWFWIDLPALLAINAQHMQKYCITRLRSITSLNICSFGSSINDMENSTAVNPTMEEDLENGSNGGNNDVSERTWSFTKIYQPIQNKTKVENFPFSISLV